MNNLAKLALDNGGFIKPIIIPSNLTSGTGLMNPSMFLDDDGILKMNLRHVNYTFYHSEAKLFQHQWGPLTYIHPEHDMHLRTWNWYLELDKDLNITRYSKVDTSKFDTYEPKWDFVGLEDARIFRWNKKLYLSGVRRDTTPHGQGRMELSEIIVDKDSVIEVSRVRIEPPKDSYCEKNWMPVMDMPFHYVKWSNPTEVVKADPITGVADTVFLTERVPINADFRGGSQVIRFRDYYVAVVHEVSLFKSEVGRKDGLYRHRFLVWDDKFNLVKHSPMFAFMDAHVEFAVGMVERDGNMLISFGFQDNAAYIMSMSCDLLEKFIKGEV